MNAFCNSMLMSFKSYQIKCFGPVEKVCSEPFNNFFLKGSNLVRFVYFRPFLNTMTNTAQYLIINEKE